MLPLTPPAQTAMTGLEPVLVRLTGECSAIELHRKKLKWKWLETELNRRPLVLQTSATTN